MKAKAEGGTDIPGDETGKVGWGQRVAAMPKRSDSVVGRKSLKILEEEWT